MQTRTGHFPLGFRRMDFDWHADLDSLIAWMKANGLSVIDLGRDADMSAQRIKDAGLTVGTVDLPVWQDMLSPDRAKRTDAIARNAEYIRTCSAADARLFFLVMLPENPDLPRKENFAFMVDSFGELTSTLEAVNGKIVIEGWPGPGALCCTPEGYRAFFEQCPSSSMGINYDPSHLLRMGIDPHRFLIEFKDRVHHVHGKDCMLLADNLYEYGSEQPPTFATPIPWGNMHWRYTLPGHGLSRWPFILQTLADNNYSGAITIELEDVHYSGSTDAEKLGIMQGATFLANC